jgi:hypothetical protein
MAKIETFIFLSTFLSTNFENENMDWRLVKNENKIKIFSKKTLQGYDAIKILCTIDCSLPAFINVINDANNYSKWVYSCSESMKE